MVAYCRCRGRRLFFEAPHQTPLLLSCLVATASLAVATEAGAQRDRADLEGMWSDAPGTVVDSFCGFTFCFDAGVEHLRALLDDPSNDERPVIELYWDAARHQREQYLRPRMTPEGLATLGMDPADDTGFLECEPWGFLRQITAPHQLQITDLGDRIEMRYGEWDAHRTVFMDGRERPRQLSPSRLGYSIGRYEGDTLVIETSAIAANLAIWDWDWATRIVGGRHSDQLRVIERYTRSPDGDRFVEHFLSVVEENRRQRIGERERQHESEGSE